MKLWKKVVVGLTLCALPCIAYAYGTQVPGQLYSCTGKHARKKTVKMKICSDAKQTALYVFVARLDDYRERTMSCAETNKPCVFEQ